MGEQAKTRDATAEDVSAALRSNGRLYASTAEPALAWLLGPAQRNISAAVDAALAAGSIRLVDTRNTTYGRGVRFLAHATQEA